MSTGPGDVSFPPVELVVEEDQVAHGVLVASPDEQLVAVFAPWPTVPRGSRIRLRRPDPGTWLTPVMVTVGYPEGATPAGSLGLVVVEEPPGAVPTLGKVAEGLVHELLDGPAPSWSSVLAEVGVEASPPAGEVTAPRDDPTARPAVAVTPGPAPTQFSWICQIFRWD